MMKRFRPAGIVALTAALVSSSWAKTAEKKILGDVTWPAEWTVFAPAGTNAPPLPAAALRAIPETLTVGKMTLQAHRVQPTGHQFDFTPLFGSVVTGQTAYVFLALESAQAGRATLGFGADWWLQAWINGELVLDTTDSGNDYWPPAIDNHVVDVDLRRGANVLALRFLCGSGSAILALGGPRELRAPLPPSLVQKNANSEFEQLAARLPSGAIRPTQGWAPEFRRDPVEPDRDRVALRTDWGDNLLTESAVTFGVPFPRNVLPNPTRARLLDAAGRSIPAQIAKTANWDGPDGSVRWALCHARMRRGQQYFIEYGRRVSGNPPPGIALTETDREITVTTGPMRFVVSKSAPTLIHTAAWTRDETRGAAAEVVTAAQASEALPAVTDLRGNVYRAAPEGLSVEVVERGLARVALRRQGWYVDDAGTRFCQFVTYTYFLAGDAGFRHDHTLVIAFDTHEHQIRDIEVPLPLNLQGPRQAWFATDTSPDGALARQDLDATTAISLIEHYRDGWRLLRGDQQLAAGKRSGGWFGMADSRGGAFAGIEHFWENSPAELTAAGNRLSLHLYASRGTEPLDFRPSRILGQRDEPYPGKRVFYSRWYRDGLDEMTQGYGTAKTHSLHFRFFTEPGREAAAQQARTVNQPVFAYPEPEWACRTEAFGRVWHYDPERFPEIEAILDAIVHRRLWLRERLQNYGWFHFGAINGNLSYPGDPERISFNHWRRWASMFYGNPNVMPNLFLRSGRRDAWDFHRVNTRHVTDIDICNLDGDAFGKWKGGRYGGNGGIVHFAADQYSMGPDTHLRFMLYDYYLNGNLRTWEVANFYAAAYAARRKLPQNLRYKHRGTGGPLRLFSEAYQATWNPEYLEAMRQFAEILYQAEAELGVIRYDDVYMNEGKIFYYQITGDQRMRDLFLNDMRVLRQRKDAHVFSDPRSTTMYGLAHAYWFSGDRAFLPFALWQLHVAKQGVITAGDPGRIGAIDWALEFAYNATLANQLPALMAALVDVGDARPRAEAPDISGTTGALHFLQEQDGAIEIAVNIKLYTGVARPFRNWRSWMQRLPEAARPALVLLGPDGRELQRLPLDAAATDQPGDTQASNRLGPVVPAGVRVFRHPADGQTGVYTIHPTSLAVPLRLSLYSANLERWMADTRDAAITGDPHVPCYFRVPAGTGAFSLRVKTSSLRGEQTVEIFDDADGKRGETTMSGGARTWQTIALNAGRPARAQAWSIRVFPKTELYLELNGVPAYVSSAPEALFETDRHWTARLPAATPTGSDVTYRTAQDLGGVPVADLPAAASLSIASSDPARALADPEQGTVEMWVLSHRRPDDVGDRVLLTLGKLRLYRRANIGTYLYIDGAGHQTGLVLPMGRWTHLAATWGPNADGGLRVALYADGIRVDGGSSRGFANAAKDWPGNTLHIPRAGTALSIAGLRVSNRQRYGGNFEPPPQPLLDPEESTTALWPLDTEGTAWVFDRRIKPAP